MRSSIFDSHREPRRKVALPVPRSVKRRPSPLEKPRQVSWNLDEMVASYVESRALPPLLSPSLPPWEPREREEVRKEEPKREAQAKEPREARVSKREPRELREPDREPKREPREAKEAKDTGREGREEGRVKYVNRSGDARPRFLVRLYVKKLDKPHIDRSATLKLAKETKYLSEKTDGVLSLIMELDSLMLFAQAYDLKAQWISLASSIEACTHKINKYANSKLQPQWKCLQALLYKFQAAVFHKIIAALSNDDKSSRHTIQSYEKIFKLHRDSELTCPDIHSFLQAEFPKTYAKNRGAWGVLPTFEEFVGFFCDFCRELIELYNRESMESVIYSLKAGRSWP